VASFAIDGTLTDTKGDTASFLAEFSATFAGESPQQVLTSSLSTNGTSPVEAYAESVVFTVTPEPMTFAMIGLGFVAIGCLRLKRGPRAQRADD
jgi:hypothetical protein